MGKRGPQPKGIVASFSYWLRPIGLTRDRAGEIFGMEVLQKTWDEIEAAWIEHDSALSRAGSSNTVRGHRDARSRALGRLRGAIALVHDQMSDTHGNRALRASLWPASGMEDAELMGRIEARDLTGSLAEVEAILRASLLAVRDAAPLETDALTEGEIKAQLVRALHGLLWKAGLPCAISGGGGAGKNRTDRDYADLKPFELFIHESGAHQSNSAEALSKWLREACGTKR